MRQILIVDDEPHVLETTRYILESEGYRVFTARHGAEALERLRELRPRAVLLDVTMPIMDGYAVCREIRADPALRETFVIFLTARSQRSEEELGRQAGADAFLRKPFDDESILRLIEPLFPEARDG